MTKRKTGTNLLSVYSSSVLCNSERRPWQDLYGFTYLLQKDCLLCLLKTQMVKLKFNNKICQNIACPEWLIPEKRFIHYFVVNAVLSLFLSLCGLEVKIFWWKRPQSHEQSEDVAMYRKCVDSDVTSRIMTLCPVCAALSCCLKTNMKGLCHANKNKF